MTRDEIKAEIKAQLGEYSRLREDCGRLCRKIEDKREDMAQLRAVAFNGMARQSGEIADSVERAVELMDGLIGYYTKMVTEREQAEQHVLELLDQVKNSEGRRVLYLRYIEGRSFDDIPETLSISSRTMWTKYKGALEELCDFADAGQEKNTNS